MLQLTLEKGLAYSGSGVGTAKVISQCGQSVRVNRIKTDLISCSCLRLLNVLKLLQTRAIQCNELS